MKYFSLLLSFIFLPFFVHSQLSSSIELVGGYTLSNQTAKGINTISSQYKGATSFRYGLNTSFRIFENTLFKTGIRYAKLGHVSGFYKIDPNSIDDTRYYHYLYEHYLEVPLVFRQEFGRRKLSYFFELGVSPHFFLHGKKVVDYDSYLIVNDDEIEHLNGQRVRMAYLFSVGINYNITKNEQLFIQPIFRYYPAVRNRLNFAAESFIIVNNYAVEIGFRRALSFVKDEG